MRDNGMALEFRAAVTALGRAQLIPDAVSPTTEEVLLKWFAGKTMPGAANTLKRVQIYERISLANARHMLISFSRWLPRTGTQRPGRHPRLPALRTQENPHHAATGRAVAAH